MSVSPAPLVPADCDIHDFPYVPIERGRLFRSEFHAHADTEEWRAGVTLWLKAFDQVPASSLPNDDTALARLAEFGSAIKAWKKVRPKALRGWFECSDGRLYHRVVAEKALEAWIGKLNQRKASEAGHRRRYHLPADPSAERLVDHAIDHAKRLLAALNPRSRALKKRRQNAADGTATGSLESSDCDAVGTFSEAATGSATGRDLGPKSAAVGLPNIESRRVKKETPSQGEGTPPVGVLSGNLSPSSTVAGRAPREDQPHPGWENDASTLNGRLPS